MIDVCSQFMTSLNNNGLFSEIQEILKINPLCSLDKDLIHFYKSYWTNIMSYYTQDVLQRAGFINMYHLLDYLNCHNKPIHYLKEMNINNMTNECIIEIACYVYGFPLEKAIQFNWIINNDLSSMFLMFDEWAMSHIREVRYDAHLD